MSPTPAAVGISWPCASASHGTCDTPGCRCACHYRPEIKPVQREIVSTPLERTATPPNDAPTNLPLAPGKLCPKCGAEGLVGDNFCRRDGTKLSATPRCPSCNVTIGESDLYCPNCGSPTTSEISVR